MCDLNRVEIKRPYCIRSEKRQRDLVASLLWQAFAIYVNKGLVAALDGTTDLRHAHFKPLR